MKNYIYKLLKQLFNMQNQNNWGVKKTATSVPSAYMEDTGYKHITLVPTESTEATENTETSFPTEFDLYTQDDVRRYYDLYIEGTQKTMNIGATMLDLKVISAYSAIKQAEATEQANRGWEAKRSMVKLIVDEQAERYALARFMIHKAKEELDNIANKKHIEHPILIEISYGEEKLSITLDSFSKAFKSNHSTPQAAFDGALKTMLTAVENTAGQHGRAAMAGANYGLILDYPTYLRTLENKYSSQK